MIDTPHDPSNRFDPKRSGWTGRHPVATRLGAVLVPLCVALVGFASACLDRPLCGGGGDGCAPVTTNIFVDKITQTSVDKIDLLFMIDNSISMSDKQAILRLAVPDLVGRLVDPICVDAMGNQFRAPAQGQRCPVGQSREFNPVEDIHIGIVSSSMGDVGANSACPKDDSFDGYVADKVDMAHLIGSLPRSQGTANDPAGFLAWQAGETDIGDFNRDFQRMVSDVGELGCGWEASLESWYRFLVDPFPYQELIRVQCPGSQSQGLNCVQPRVDSDNRIVLDTELLAQREAFLRPDSLVAIIMLSDENDCSIQVGNQTWVVAQIGATAMFRGSSDCALDPNSKCCYSCPLTPPAGCERDPICAADPSVDADENRLPQAADGRNLRCFQQKRRFGVDFLYPTDRYVNALSEFRLCWDSLDLDPDNCAPERQVPNPLYDGPRDPSLVFLGGIVGVPWQLIASDVDANQRPIADPTTQLRFKTAAELDRDNVWAEIVGSPGVPWQPARDGESEVAGIPATPPTSPYMIESDVQRQGIAVGNEINGREYDTTQSGATSGAPDDLQYACIFPLPESVDCTERDPVAGDACDCYSGDFDRPLCEQTPGNGNPGTTQYWSKAFPGTRQLQVLRDYGANSIVASICARNVDVGLQDRPDFGYRPAIAAIVDRLKEQLGDRCLPRPLNVNDEDGTVPCTLVETIPQPDGACVCDPAIARRVPAAEVDSVVRGQLANEPGDLCGTEDPSCQGACLCEVQQVQQVEGAAPNALQVCQNDETASGVEGWCYVDGDRGVGNPELVADCPATERRLLRFVGQGLLPNTTTFVACTGSSFNANAQLAR